MRNREWVSRVEIEAFTAGRLAAALKDLQYIALNALNQETVSWIFRIKMMGYDVEFDRKKQRFSLRPRNKFLEMFLNKMLLLGRSLAVNELSELSQMIMASPPEEKKQEEGVPRI